MIAKKVFNADGSNKRFLSDFIIQSEQFTRVYAYIYDNTLPADGTGDKLQDGTTDQANWVFPTNVWKRGADAPNSGQDLLTIDKWDLVSNSILMYSAPIAPTKIWIEVATTPEEFGDTLTQPSVERAELAADTAVANRVITDANVVLTNADAVATAADRVQTGLDAIATAADRVQTGLDVIATNTDAAATAADVVLTNADVVLTHADVVLTNADVVLADAAAAAAAASYDNFDDRYLGAKASNPTLDNDGNPLLTGALYWNTTVNEMRTYDGVIWNPLGGGGATGGGTDKVFLENDQTITADYTITSGKNAVTAGDVTINDGVTVTVPDGSRWAIV